MTRGTITSIERLRRPFGTRQLPPRGLSLAPFGAALSFRLPGKLAREGECSRRFCLPEQKRSFHAQLPVPDRKSRFCIQVQIIEVGGSQNAKRGVAKEPGCSRTVATDERGQQSYSQIRIEFAAGAQLDEFAPAFMEILMPGRCEAMHPAPPPPCSGLSHEFLREEPAQSGNGGARRKAGGDLQVIRGRDSAIDECEHEQV